MATQGIRNQLGSLTVLVVAAFLAFGMMAVIHSAHAGETGVQVDKEATYSTIRMERRTTKKSKSQEKLAKRDVAGTDTAEVTEQNQVREREQISIEHRGLRGDLR